MKPKLHKTVIYGHSDDCIEIESDGPIGRDEFSWWNKPGFLHFSDGTVVRCEYTDKGLWDICRVKGSMEVTMIREESNKDDYTDRLTIVTPEPFLWVDVWSSADGPNNDELRDKIGYATEQADWHHGLKFADLREVWRIIKGRKA